MISAQETGTPDRHGKSSLTVDDDPVMRRLMTNGLELPAMAAFTRHDGPDGQDPLAHGRYDPAIRDRISTGPDNPDTTRRIRQRHGMPITMLTIKVRYTDRVASREPDADNDVIKPFISREQRARIGAALHGTSGNMATCGGDEPVRRDRFLPEMTRG